MKPNLFTDKVFNRSDLLFVLEDRFEDRPDVRCDDRDPVIDEVDSLYEGEVRVGADVCLNVSVLIFHHDLNHRLGGPQRSTRTSTL